MTATTGLSQSTHRLSAFAHSGVSLAPRPGLCGAVALSTPEWTGVPLLRLHMSPTTQRPLADVSRPTLMAVKRGQVRLRLDGRNGRSCALSTAGDVSLLSPGEAADTSWSNVEPVEHLIAELPRELCERLLQRTVRWTLPNERPSRFAVGDQRLVYLMSALEEQCQQGEPMGTLYTEGISAALIAYVDRRYGGRNHEDGQDGARLPGRSRRHRLVEYIEAHLSGSLRVSDLAATINCSPQKLTRLFQVEFGMAPYRYVMLKRAQRAQSLLSCDAGGSIAEIALACGFSSQAHLTVAFKAVFGETPAAFRSLHAPIREAASVHRKRAVP